MRKKIVIVTTGQPSTNPRMVKEYQALKRAGFEVTVLYSYWVDWAVETDEILFEKGDLQRSDFLLAGGSPTDDRWKYLLSRIIHKVSRKMAGYWPGLFGAFAIARPACFLWWTSRKIKADLYIAHNLGALPPAVWAARKHKAECGFDLEDFYSGQFEPSGNNEYRNTAYLEKKFIPGCHYLTAASPLIADVYQALFRNRTIPVINNVFSKVFLQSPPETNGTPLRLFWFSQTVGSNRGLETIVQAINFLQDYDIRFDIMGSCSAVYRQHLTDMVIRKESLQFLQPIPADDLFGVAASYDIGMAAEIPHSENRDRCLTNKLFVYLMSGNCILASDTRAQKLLMDQHAGIGFLYRYDDPKELAGRLADLYNNPAYLQQCKQQARTLAADRYNWEYEESLFMEQIQSTLHLP